jgi:hypothetical protein
MKQVTISSYPFLVIGQKMKNRTRKFNRFLHFNLSWLTLAPYTSSQLNFYLNLIFYIKCLMFSMVLQLATMKGVFLSVFRRHFLFPLYDRYVEQS